MRCLSCKRNGLPANSEKCPHCNAIMTYVLRDMLPSKTTLHNGRYCIDYPLGRGGFGITYRAFDTNLERVVVIKEFFPQEQAMRKGESGHVAVPTTQHVSYEKALSYFLKEARILANLNKENIVRVYDFFENHNTAYIVMELVEGDTLRELLSQQPEGYFNSAEVEKITGQMVYALDAIHRHEVFHLDISPDNVLQTREGKIVLIDFGAARQCLRTKDSNSSGGAHQYKLAYAAPEIIAGARVGPRSDLFELAMMTHELLTGLLPPSVLQRAATKDLWQPNLPDAKWQKLLTRALHLEQEMRPASVVEWWDTFSRQKIVFGAPTKEKGIVIGGRGGKRLVPGRPVKKH